MFEGGFKCGYINGGINKKCIVVPGVLYIHS